MQIARFHLLLELLQLLREFLLFHRTFFMDAIMDLVEVLMVLYPPYLLFVLVHHEFVRRRGADLSKTLFFETVETKMKGRLG